MNSIESIDIVPTWAATTRVHLSILQQKNPPAKAVEAIKEELRKLADAQVLNMIAAILDGSNPDEVSHAISGITLLASRQDNTNHRLRRQA